MLVGNSCGVTFLGPESVMTRGASTSSIPWVDLAILPELNPPSVMPRGNVGTSLSTFMALIRACKLPASLIKKLRLEFPNSRSSKRYGAVAFEYGFGERSGRSFGYGGSRDRTAGLKKNDNGDGRGGDGGAAGGEGGDCGGCMHATSSCGCKGGRGDDVGGSCGDGDTAGSNRTRDCEDVRDDVKRDCEDSEEEDDDDNEDIPSVSTTILTSWHIV